MLPHHTPPPRNAGKLALMVVGIVGFMIVAIFVGFNLYHADTMREQQSGQLDQRDAPKSPTDLQSTPAPPGR